MPKENEKSLFNFDNIKSAFVFVFLVGGAWARLEYKIDQSNLAVQTMFEKYVIQNEGEKKIQALELGAVRRSVDFNSSRIEDIQEFLKPESPEIKHKNYR